VEGEMGYINQGKMGVDMLPLFLSDTCLTELPVPSFRLQKKKLKETRVLWACWGKVQSGPEKRL